jgi:hypothetical protein
LRLTRSGLRSSRSSSLLQCVLHSTVVTREARSTPARGATPLRRPLRLDPRPQKAYRRCLSSTRTTDVRITAGLTYFCIRPHSAPPTSIVSSAGHPSIGEVNGSTRDSVVLFSTCGHDASTVIHLSIHPIRARQVLWLRYCRAVSCFSRPYRIIITTSFF